MIICLHGFAWLGGARPGLTDCGALGNRTLGGPQIKVKTKKKKKKRKKRSQPLPAGFPHQSMSSTIFLP